MGEDDRHSPLVDAGTHGDDVAGARPTSPGSDLALQRFGVDAATQDLTPALEAPENPALGWTAPELAEHVHEEDSTFTWLLEPMLERAGFEIRDRWLGPNRIYARTRASGCSGPGDQRVRAE